MAKLTIAENICKGCSDSARQLKRKIQQRAEELLSYDLAYQKEKAETVLTYEHGKPCLKTYSRKFPGSPVLRTLSFHCRGH